VCQASKQASTASTSTTASSTGGRDRASSAQHKESRTALTVRASAASAATTKLPSIPADNTEQLEKTQPSWGNYPKGVTAEYLKHLNRTESLGAHAAIVSTVPVGSGLSSSAALEAGFFMFLESLFENKGASAIQKARLRKEAEHEYCSVPWPRSPCRAARRTAPC
jgi:galactokinase